MARQFIAGIIGGPFGVKGFVKVKPLSGEIGHLLKLKSAILRRDGKEQSLGIEESAAIPPLLALRFAGFHTPEAARALQGAELLVDQENAAPLREGEFYVEDLKGLGVMAADNGEIVGHIAAIIEGGGGDLAEIRLHNGENRLVPFRKEFLTDIDLEKKHIILQNRWILE